MYTLSPVERASLEACGTWETLAELQEQLPIEPESALSACRFLASRGYLERRALAERGFLATSLDGDYDTFRRTPLGEAILRRERQRQARELPQPPHLRALP